MQTPLNIAFYAPIKPPDHPIASGDRLIAQNIIKALQYARFAPHLASRFIAYSKRSDTSILHARKAKALKEANRLIAFYNTTEKPQIWITYHPYCKAPDWIGPKVSAALNIAYITIEAARTGQGFENGGDRWRDWRIEAQKGLRQADLHVAFKPTDKAYLTQILGHDDNIQMLAPFIDVEEALNKTASLSPLPFSSSHTIRLLSVGMMRPGKKVENYRRIAAALLPLQEFDWHLTLIGDGPEKDHIENFFKNFAPERIHFTGSLSHETVLAHMRESDIFLWPGWKEPIGMVYLEAQLMGLPIVALDSMGVGLTVRDRITGLLAAEDDAKAFCNNLRRLINDSHMREKMSLAARHHIQHNHSLKSSAHFFQKALTI